MIANLEHFTELFMQIWYPGAYVYPGDGYQLPRNVRLVHAAPINSNGRLGYQLLFEVRLHLGPEGISFCYCEESQYDSNPV